MTKINRLKLTNFRNHKSFTFESDKNIISIIGENGKGKTNIIEAISLLVPGKGIRNSKISEYQNFASLDSINKEGEIFIPWTVFAEIELEEEIYKLGTSYEKDPSEKRIFNINGKKVKNIAEELSRVISVVSLVPTQDHTFSAGSTSRREFLDKICTVFFADYNSFLSDFESLKSQRRKILYSNFHNNDWLSTIEEQMASKALIIASYRNDVVDLLNSNMDKAELANFPSTQLEIIGDIESNLRHSKALEVEMAYSKKLSEERQRDLDSNRTNSGIHRSDLKAIHKLKNLPAQLCSMGEQKAVLLSITLATVLSKKQFSNKTPILLLDEVSAHLDEQKRSDLYNFIKDVNCQSWLTSTEKSHFEGLDCNFIECL
jgi:DNA replication and repair protein RecF